jgi:hypothetical protein
MNDSCFVILIWVLLSSVVVVACAITNEGNCGRTENDRMTNNTSIDIKTPTITLILLLVTFLDDAIVSVVVHDFNLHMIARMYFL